MTTSVLRDQLAKLSAADRAELAVFLLGTLEPPEHSRTDEEFDVMLHRRAEDVRNGQVRALATEDAMQDLQRKHT